MGQLVTVSPMSPEVVVVMTILLANLADIDRRRQLRVEIFPLRVENIGGDLTVRSQPDKVKTITLLFYQAE